MNVSPFNLAELERLELALARFELEPLTEDDHNLLAKLEQLIKEAKS